MVSSSFNSQLDALDTSAEPRAVRFDSGPPFASRVAVLPAAFNPPTRAHVHLLELAAAEPGISQVAALLSTRNVDKGLDGASLEQRVEMLLAATDHSLFAVLATNQARIADQAVALASCFPGVAFDFIVGYDTLVRLFDDRYYRDMRRELAPFFQQHQVIATNRAHHTIREVKDFLAVHPVAREYAPSILVRELPEEPASFSSTAARNHAASGLPLEQLPPAVADYVSTHQLYRDRA